jgi:CHAT domain-containing protein
LVGFGDAVFSRDYTPQGSTGAATDTGSARSETVSRLAKLPRLFNAKRELLAISDLVGKDSSFYVEYNATRANLLKLDLSQYRILHVVTHGVLDTKQPELSGIVLSLIDANQRPIDGFVSLSDIYRLRAPVDLVVLSACETAVGQRMQGEGLIGLTRGFMYAGASGVVATLWTVDDRATAELMKQFYANMLQRGMGPARALREAQNYIRSQPNWSAPYFWAGFTFQGDYDLTIGVAPVTNERGYLKLIAGVTLIALLAIAAWLLWRRLRLRRHPIRY